MGAIIALTGKEGAGKSIILSNLACLFASSDACVAVLSCDLRYQSLPHYFGSVEIPPEKSLGLLFGNADLKDRLVEYPQMRNIFIAAPAAGESCFSYEPPDAEGIAAFLSMLTGTFDYVLIEAGGVLFNQFSMLSCKNADVVINVMEASLQGMAWEDSSGEMLGALRDGGEGAIYVLNDIHDIGVASAARTVDVRIPHSLAARNAVKKGFPVVIDANAGIGARGFRRAITALHALVAERMATI